MRGLAELWLRVVPQTWQRRVRQYVCHRHWPTPKLVIYASAARDWWRWSETPTPSLQMSVQECSWELPSLSYPSSLGMRYTLSIYLACLEERDPMVAMNSRHFLDGVANRSAEHDHRPIILYAGNRREIKRILSAEASGFHWRLSDALQYTTGRTDFAIAITSQRKPFFRGWLWEEGNLTPLSIRVVDDGKHKRPYPRPLGWWKTAYP